MPVWIVGTSDLNRSGNSLASSRAIGSGALWLPTKTNRNIPQDGTNKLPFQCLPDRRNSPSCLSRKGSDLNSSNIEAVFDSSDCAPCRQGGARIKKHSLGVNRTSAIADEIAVALTVVNERKRLFSPIIRLYSRIHHVNIRDERSVGEQVRSGLRLAGWILLTFAV